MKVTCDCGRKVTFANFRPHARKCFSWLQAGVTSGRITPTSLKLLDERSPKKRTQQPIVWPKGTASM